MNAPSGSMTRLSFTNVIARSLEKQFDIIELDDIEQILASVRENGNIQQLTVVDVHKSFFLDGDPMTSPIIAVNEFESAAEISRNRQNVL